MPEFSIFLEMMAKAVAVIIFTFLGGLAIQFWNAKKTEIRLRLGEQRFAALQSGLTFILQGAQQSGLAGVIANEGAAKKEYAVQAMQAWLKGYGFTMDVKAIEAAIEAAFLQGLQNPANTPPLIPPVITVNASAVTPMTTTTTTTETPAGSTVMNSKEPQPTKEVKTVVIDAKAIEAHPNAHG